MSRRPSPTPWWIRAMYSERSSNRAGEGGRMGPDVREADHRVGVQGKNGDVAGAGQATTPPLDTVLACQGVEERPGHHSRVRLVPAPQVEGRDPFGVVRAGRSQEDVPHVGVRVVVHAV